MAPTFKNDTAASFVDGRIAKIDGYWKPDAYSLQILDKINELGLWDVAFRDPVKKWIRSYYRDYTTNNPGFRKVLGRKLGLAPPKPMKEDLKYWLQHGLLIPLQQCFRQSDLTINFNAKAMFGSGVPGYPEYTSMWERLTNKELKDYKASFGNFPNVRAKADRSAIYGQFSDGKQDVRDAKLVLPYVWDAAKGKAATGNDPDYTFKYSENKSKPDFKQVYAALNYKRRTHGANCTYGMSHIVLASGFKPKAFYFPLDTFTPLVQGSSIAPKKNRNKLYQVSATSFAGAILCAITKMEEDNPMLAKWCNGIFQDLLEAAHGTSMGTDLTKYEDYLMVEAHIFQTVRMDSDCIQKLVISKSEVTDKAARNNLERFRFRTRIPYELVD